MLYFLIFSSYAFADQKLCSNPDIMIIDSSFDLSENEKVLVCGTKESDQAWKKVPLLQAQYQLNVLLQNAGYLDATFENTGDKLIVKKGKRAETSQLIITGSNGVVEVSKKRKIVGEPMVPQKLDEVKNWIELEAKRQGHACPKIEMRAQAWDYKMFADVEAGPVQSIGEIFRSGYGTLDLEALKRYEAFEPGGQYNVIETEITIDRVMAQGLFQNAYITTICHDDKVDLNFISEVGKPKLLRFSVGASTEEFPFADVWFKNSRLDDRASSFLAQLHASNIRQTLELSSELYVLANSYRTFVGPRLKFERKNERSFESNKGEVGSDIGRAWDISHIRVKGRLGPTLNYLKTVSGQGPDELNYLSWDGSLSAASHSYEAFSRSQFEGWTGDVKYTGQRKKIGSGLNVDRYDIRLKYLYNVNAYAPPLIVIASRFETTFVDTHHRDDPTEITDLPVDLRIFYGGNNNIRGFSRHTLDNEGRGYISSLLAGFEFRLVQVAPYNLEPLLLFDSAKLGTRQYEFISPTFISYGAGLRWVSPFGTLRFSAARGQVWNNSIETSDYPREWVYNISFGEEF